MVEAANAFVPVHDARELGVEFASVVGKRLDVGPRPLYICAVLPLQARQRIEPRQHEALDTDKASS